jgi:RNA polymerase sigma-70 factor (ECF subfamily)
MSGVRAPDGDDDTVLLERARDGDAASFGTLYRRRARIVLAYLTRRTPEREQAADLMAETFAQLLVLVRTPERPLPDTPIAWLLTTARRLLIDSYRRGRVEAAGRRRLAMEPLVLEDRDLARIEEISASTDLMAELEALLPPTQWQALPAHILEQIPYSVIASQLECSEQVVRQRVSRAVRTLRGRHGRGAGDA